MFFILDIFFLTENLEQNLLRAKYATMYTKTSILYVFCLYMMFYSLARLFTSPKLLYARCTIYLQYTNEEDETSHTVRTLVMLDWRCRQLNRQEIQF